jgi:predicted secreted protein
MKAFPLLLALMLVLVGCEATDSATRDEVIAPESVAQPIMLTMDDNGKTVDLQVGQSATITLEGNPTTGYEWSVASFDNPGVLKSGFGGIYISHADASDSEPPRVGVGGTYSWTYQAVQAGKATVSLAYARSWETDTPAAKTFDVTFIVHE